MHVVATVPSHSFHSYSLDPAPLAVKSLVRAPPAASSRARARACHSGWKLCGSAAATVLAAVPSKSFSHKQKRSRSLVEVLQRPRAAAVRTMATALASKTRSAWVFPPKAGDISAMELRQEALEQPSVGEVRVRVEAIGLNFADIFTGLGLYGPIASGEVGGEEGGFVPGLELAGVVEQIGEAPGRPAPVRAHGGQLCTLTEETWALAEKATADLKVGDRVMGAVRFGAYASQVNVPAHQLRVIPEAWSFEEAAAFPVQTLTVQYALQSLGALRSGQTVLVHSAAGGCGLQAIGICLNMGAKVVGTVGSESKVQFILDRYPSLKREQLIVRDGRRFQEQLETALRNVGSSGYDIVLDAVLGEFFHPGFKALSSGGRYICYGAASMTPQQDKLGPLGWLQLAWKWLRRPMVDPLELPGMNKSVMAFNLIHCFERAEELGILLDGVLALDIPKPLVGKTFPFRDAINAMRLFRSGQTVGKVVLKVDKQDHEQV